MKRLPLLGLLTLALAMPAARAQTYIVTDLGTLGGPNSYGYSVNNAGQVTGEADTNNNTHAFLYANGAMTDLTPSPDPSVSSAGGGINNGGQVAGYRNVSAFRDTPGVGLQELGTLPGGTTSFGYAINEGGDVTGQAEAADGEHAFVYTDAAGMVDLGTLGGTYSVGAGINNRGQVTGASYINASTSHAFLDTGGVMADLGTLGGTSSAGYSVNNAGQVVGTSRTAGDAAAHAFLYQNGHMTDLGTLPHNTYSAASHINNRGQIVGTSYSGDNGQRAFLYTQSAGMTDLNTLISPASGWLLVGANGISDTHFITGYGFHNNAIHAFLLTPASTLRITSLSPDVIDMRHADFTFLVYGSGFQRSTVVRWNEQALFTLHSGTGLRAKVPASLVANSGTALITVQTPHVATSSATPFHIRPLINSLSPSAVTAGSAAFTLHVTGAGFTSNALVVFNGTNLVTTFVSPTQLTATVPAALVAAHGRKSVMVTLPHVATSQGAAFDVSR